MFDFTSLTKISLMGIVFFGLLWLITPKDKVYETVEMDTVALKTVFLSVTIVCLGFFLASLFLW